MSSVISDIAALETLCMQQCFGPGEWQMVDSDTMGYQVIVRNALGSSVEVTCGSERDIYAAAFRLSRWLRSCTEAKCYLDLRGMEVAPFSRFWHSEGNGPRCEVHVVLGTDDRPLSLLADLAGRDAQVGLRLSWGTVEQEGKFFLEGPGFSHEVLLKPEKIQSDPVRYELRLGDKLESLPLGRLGVADFDLGSEQILSLRLYQTLSLSGELPLELVGRAEGETISYHRLTFGCHGLLQATTLLPGHSSLS